MNQRSRRLTRATTPSLPRVLILLCALAIPMGLAAGDHAHKSTHHHYKLIDMGTLGGPQSFFNTLGDSDAFSFLGFVGYGNSLVLNPNGTLIGFADTAALEPYPPFCWTNEDPCHVIHAFQWSNGVRTDLGTLPGGANSLALWINDKGWIAGTSNNGQLDPIVPGLPQIRAVVWKEGRIEDLGTLGGSASFSSAINDRGQVTGAAQNGTPDPFSFYYLLASCAPFQICPENGTQTRAFVWDEKGGMQDIGTLGGPDAAPSLINQHGQITGSSYTDSIPQPTTGFPTLHPFLWERGKGMKDLGSLGGTSTASVNALNERGEVVGGSYLPGDFVVEPFLWDGKKLIDLIAPPFVTGGEANWINEAGEVVGGASLAVSCADTGLLTHGFLWKNGLMTDLGDLPGFPRSRADFINSRTQIVGAVFPCDFSAAIGFLWENGAMVDLNALVPPDAPVQVFWAAYISDRGEIVAYALPRGTLQLHTVLLLPCDENHPGIEGCDYSMVDLDTPLAPRLAAMAGQAGWATRDSKSSVAVQALTALSSTRALPAARESTPVRQPFLRQPGFARFMGSAFPVMSVAPVTSGPSATVLPAGLTFSTQAVGTTSATETVTVKNTGTTTLAISGITIAGTDHADFAQTHTCGSSLGAGASCSISVTFSPTASGTRTAILSVTDNAAGSPQKVSLSGIGTTAKLSPTSFNFGAVATGTTSLAKTVTLTNVGTTTLTISGIAISGVNVSEFAQTHTCGSSLLAGASCSISVTFKPTTAGTRAAALDVTDNAAGSPQTVSLTGIGTTTKVLTGYCRGTCRPRTQSSQCPIGQPAKTPGVISLYPCGVIGSRAAVDFARHCLIPPGSFGYCETN